MDHAELEDHGDEGRDPQSRSVAPAAAGQGPPLSRPRSPAASTRVRSTRSWKRPVGNGCRPARPPTRPTPFACGDHHGAAELMHPTTIARVLIAGAALAALANCSSGTPSQGRGPRL